MTVTQHDTRDEEQAGLHTSPGHRLREARLSAKIGIEEMAARLHLDSKLVEALENDQYADLPEPTFVRGYLRGYARVLGLPPAPIIEAYDQHGFGAPQLIPDIASRPQAQSSDTSVRLVIFVVTAVLVALMLAWWQSQQTVVTMPSDQPAANVPEHTEEPAGEPDKRIARESDDPTLPSEPAPESTTAAAEMGDTAPGMVLAEPREPDTAAPVIEETVVPSRPVPNEQPVSAQIPPGETIAIAQPAPEPVPVEPATRDSPSGDRLDIRFEHDSWVEIYDKEETRLYFGLAKAGQSVSVSGGAPIRVLLGYARDVQIMYNGELFDPAPHMREDVARFTLGEASGP